MNNINGIFTHRRDVHGLDLGVLAKRHSMDTFSFIRSVFIVGSLTFKWDRI